MNSIFQLHKNSNFSARKDGASQTTPFFFIFPFHLATVRTKLFYKQTDIGTSLLCAIMSLPDKLGYENSMGKATFWIFALLSPVWLVSIKKQPKEKRKKKQTKEHRLDCKNKNRSKASHLVLSFSIKRQLVAFNPGPIQYLHVVNTINSIFMLLKNYSFGKATYLKTSCFAYSCQVCLSSET